MYTETEDNGVIIDRNYNGQRFLLESDILSNPLYHDGEKWQSPALTIQNKKGSYTYEDIRAARRHSIKFSWSQRYDALIELTELQNIKKPVPALLGVMQGIDERIQEGTATPTDYYLKDNGVLEKMMELFLDGGYSAKEIYNIVMSKLPDTSISMYADFSSIENFVQFIKNTLMPRVRSIGFEASKKHLIYKLNKVTTRKAKIETINEFLVNIGRSARDNYKEQGITSNRQF